MKLKLNRENFTDKILGCWIGKNIGGTMGTPYEGMRTLNDIHGFNSPKGEPLPNDDLDLQLVWLKAMQDVGPRFLNANVLADYWLSQITPHWNEYGIGKTNLNLGFLPPMCGEFNNIWKDSNGAWIRSEIWACLAPGVPNVAIKYAIMDASIDHGLSEGTYGEMFTASLESLAFFEDDLRTLIEKALSFIPDNCRVARAVKLVLDCYDNNVPWQETRERILEDSKDLGWFMAPGNIAFTILGLVYGEGDFKKSLIYAINCGDDTDCTGATAGSVLGIIKGASGIPEDWKEYIGDRIIPICVNASYRERIPATCTQLTEWVIDTLPMVMNEYGIDVEFTDAESEIDSAEAAKVLDGYVADVFSRSRWSFEVNSITHTDAIVEYEKAPQVKPGDTFKIKVTLKNKRYDPHYYEVNAQLPEGWTADYNRVIYAAHNTVEVSRFGTGVGTWEMTITVGENVAPVNRIPIVLTSLAHAVPVTIPVVLVG